MGGSTSKTKSYPVPKTAREKQLERTQLQFARETLDAFRAQGEFQRVQAALAPTALEEISGQEDPLSALSRAERSELIRDYYMEAMEGTRRAAELSDLELERIKRGAAATPEQAALIKAVADAELASGLQDISRYAGEEREALAEELAPRLGLHRSDTPILDRGGRISSAAIEAAAKLVSDVRGRQAQAMLSYPLAAGEYTGTSALAQQQLGYSRADVLADLNQRAYENRLALTGQIGAQGLGLASAYNVPAAQESFKPVIATESETAGGGVFYGSSRTLKKILAVPNGAEILRAIEELPVAFWKYLSGEDQQEHIGPFAEDFKEAFDLGNGKGLDLRDVVGVLLVGLQELAAELHTVRGEEAT